MASGTWHLLVLAIEFKGSFVMIKVSNFPEICCMTAETFRLAVGLELPEMDIRMALGTGGGQGRKLLNGDAVGSFFEMAIPAGRLQVTPG